MQLDIVYIINNKLHNLKYLNFTISFYIIFFYTYYNLIVYLLNKNYIIVLLYFIFFILLYSSYKNFTYFIGFVILITLKLFNIDSILNTYSINLVNKLNFNNIENLENNTFSSLMTKIESKAKTKENELKKNSKENKPPNNPCKTYIVTKLQQAGVSVSTQNYNTDAQNSATQAKINDMWGGMNNVREPRFHRI